MTEPVNSAEALARENDSLRAQLEEATEVLTAIRTGGVDALVVEGPNGEQVFTLQGADYPYRTFVEAMNEGAVTLALDGTIIYCNRRFADLVFTRLEQTVGRRFRDFVASPDQIEFETLLAEGDDSGVQTELSLKQTDGTTIPVRLSARRLPRIGGDNWCLVVTDLRERKLQEAQAADLLERRRSEEAMQKWSTNLEQEVRRRTEELLESRERLRALAVELNLAEQRERKRIAIELHDYLAQLLALAIMRLAQVRQKPESNTDRLIMAQELVSEALNYTRTLVTDLTPPMLHEFGLPAALRWLAEKMERHQLSVTIESSGQDDFKLPEAQALLLFQSIRELLINASKHSGAGEATVSLARIDGELRVEVRDRGKGFDKDAKAKGGDPVNFGLFSIRERMMALGGSFALESEPEKGTSALLVLPLGVENTAGSQAKALRSDVSESTINHQPPPRNVQGMTSVPTTQTSRQQPIRVLLVDDHAMVRQGLRSLLDSYIDIEVVGEASNGQDALAGMMTHQPSIVVMDINMPIMNGIDATAVIRDLYPKIHVIGLSVQAGEEMQQAMLKAGASALLTKEAAVDQLYQAIQAVQQRTVAR